MITKLRGYLPAGKLITVFQYNIPSNQIDATAAAQIDYAYANFIWHSIQIDGLTKAHYAPFSLNLGDFYYDYELEDYEIYANDTAEGGYGAIMNFNLRTKSGKDPLPVFNAIASGAWGESVTCTNGNRPQDWTFVEGGYTITIDDVK